MAIYTVRKGIGNILGRKHLPLFDPPALNIFLRKASEYTEYPIDVSYALGAKGTNHIIFPEPLYQFL